MTEVCPDYGDIQKVDYALPATLKLYDFYFKDNREQILGIGYCTANNAVEALRFQTWRIRYKLNGSGAVTEQLFGGPETGTGFVCKSPDTISQEITKWTAYIDEEDIEGLRFEFEDNSIREYKANHPTPNPIVILKGRPIGFKTYTGTNSNGTPNMPLQIQLIYNSCMCPLSFFIP